MLIMEEQIKKTYFKAFCNLLEEKIDSETPDYDWVVRLYAEIKKKLVTLSPKRLQNDIEERLDIELFEQMLRNKAFVPEDFYKLVTYVFDLCLQLQSPERDEYTKQKKVDTLQFLQSGASFGKIVPIFIINANECLDYIIEDIKNLEK